MKHYLKTLILLFLISVSIGTKAQLNFRKGYVITNSNDTLHGKINDGGGNRNSRICLFKQSKASKVIKYYPADIKAYRFINDKYYASKKVFIRGESRYVFVDVLVEGKINLYNYRKTKNMTYYIEKKDSNMIGLVYKVITLYSKSKSPFNRLIYSHEYDLKYTPFLDTLYYLFRDCEKIQKKLDAVEYDQRSLTNIIQDYLSEVCKENDCINYTRDLKINGPRFGLFTGIRLNRISFLPYTEGKYTYDHLINPKNDISFPIGAFMNIPMSRINDGLSFQIELIANNIKHYHEFNNLYYGNSVEIASNTIGIPILLKYEILKGNKLSPSISIGNEMNFVYSSKGNFVSGNRNSVLSLRPIQSNGLLFELGLNYKLSPKLSLFSNLRVQSFKNQFNPPTIDDYARSSRYWAEYKTSSMSLYVGLKF